MKVHIILGSKSDQAVADRAIAILDEFNVQHAVDIISAHRNPKKLEAVVIESQASVFIAIAGLSAALPGAIAAQTTRPVIGVPVSGKVNLDSILSIVQMPKGIPVAAVGLDRGDNAALLAIEILSLQHAELAEELERYRNKMRV